jgi:hypothetical protein
MGYGKGMNTIETIRKEIRNSQDSRYVIGKGSEVDPAILCRIMQGKTCTAEVADRLLSYFGYTLTKRQGQKKGE